MFIQRLLTTIVLVPLLLWLIYYGPLWALACVFFFMLVVGAWEWGALVPFKSKYAKLALVVATFFCIWLCYLSFNYWLIASLVIWGLLLFAIVMYPLSQKYWGQGFVVVFLCITLLPAFAVSLGKIYLGTNGKNLGVFLLFLVWFADTGAYIFGKLWGKHKLIPKVSPGKTIEGSFGGLLFSFALGVGGFYFFMPKYGIAWFLIILVTIIISIFGDLFISMLKRRCNIKDTGCILPGHGGVLDRVDSLISATPLFYFTTWLFS